MTKARFKQSTESCKHPYMRVGFWSKPENQFWNKAEHVVIDPITKVAERVLAYTENAKKNYQEWVNRIEAREAKYKLPQLTLNNR